MTVNVKPAEVAQPFFDRTSEHDSPHGADMDQVYRCQTDSLIWRCSGNTKTITWPYCTKSALTGTTQTAPFAAISAVSTWANFQFSSTWGDYNVGIPWRFTEGHEKILIYTTLIGDGDTNLKVRWDSETLLDAVATVTGEVTGCAPRPNMPIDQMSWMQRAGRNPSTWWQTGLYSWLTPTVPSSRVVKLVPYVETIRDDPRFAVSQTILVFMVSAVFMDIPSKDTIGW